MTVSTCPNSLEVGLQLTSPPRWKLIVHNMSSILEQDCQGDDSKKAISMQEAKLTITLLDHDALRHIFSFLRASDLDNGVARTCEVLRDVACSPTLWRDLCFQTGKTDNAALESFGPPSIDSDFYYRLYHYIHCVPLDHATIGEALAGQRNATITLMPGVYEERLVFKSSATISAADPKRGAAIVWYHPCQNHSVNDNVDSVCSHCGHGVNESIVEVGEPDSYVSLHNLTLLHYSEGTDLWHGNSAIYCHGGDTTLTYLAGCSIQSDSGRGVVISKGAGVNIARSSIHDCAATGLYLGDEGSCLDLATSNILRNGFGRRRPAVSDNGSRPWPPTIDAGHSGLYVEASECTIRNSFVALNCLIGLSVVRDSNVKLSYSLFAGNGADPVVVFQEEGEMDEDDDDSVGAINEHSNVFDLEIPSEEQMELSMLRCKWVYNQPLSPAVLHEIYGA